MWWIFFFFFQAEDGIRDYKVTGVQTCALPIYPDRVAPPAPPHDREEATGDGEAARRAPLPHREDAGPEQGEERCMARQDADLAVVRRRDHRVGGPIEYRPLGGNDRDVHHSGRGQTFRLLHHLVDRRHHVERLFRELIEFPRHDALERANGVLELHVLALEPGELGGHEERLRQEALYPARAPR